MYFSWLIWFFLWFKHPLNLWTLDIMGKSYCGWLRAKNNDWLIWFYPQKNPFPASHSATPPSVRMRVEVTISLNLGQWDRNPVKNNEIPMEFMR